MINVEIPNVSGFSSGDYIFYSLLTYMGFKMPIESIGSRFESWAVFKNEALVE